MFARSYILNLWCNEKGSGAERQKNLIEGLQANIIKNGYTADMSELTKRVGYICNRIVTFWLKYNRTKALILQYQSDWLKEKEIIMLSCAPSTSKSSDR